MDSILCTCGTVVMAHVSKNNATQLHPKNMTPHSTLNFNLISLMQLSFSKMDLILCACIPAVMAHVAKNNVTQFHLKNMKLYLTLSFTLDDSNATKLRLDDCVPTLHA